MLPVPLIALPVTVPVVTTDDHEKKLPLMDEEGVNPSCWPEQMVCRVGVPVFGGVILRIIESMAKPVEEHEAVVPRLVEAVR